MTRIAAAADLHTRSGEAHRVRGLFANARDDADILVLAGDLTDHGAAAERDALLDGLADIGIPIVAVLGNHDHESGEPDKLVRALVDAGVRVLDRERPGVVMDGVGFAGVKGFAGGFGSLLVRGFGEATLKAFVQESIAEADALREALLALPSARKVAILHYAPVQATIESEPAQIWGFLGTTRLEEAVDQGGARLVLHGHAHHGRRHGVTARGAPVHNVSLPVLKASGETRAYAVLDV